MLPLLALFLAGLGLFFYGLSGLKHSVQGLASRRVRGWLARWSRSPLLAGLWGFCLGGLTQSVTAVAFIVASLVGGGLLTVRRALPVVACANFGTAALVLVASFDIHLAVLLALGLMGIAVAFDLGGPAKTALTGLFFVALLFFGLRQMKEAFAPLPGLPWFATVAVQVQSSLLATFVLGAALRLFIQSSPAIAVIAITLNRSGLLSTDQVVAMIFGTGLGVGGAVFLLASNLRGVPRQIALYQALLSMSACVVAGGLFALERATGWPLLMHALQRLPGTAALHLAYVFAAMQFIAVGLAVASARWMAPLLARLSPPTVEQDLSRPAFIHEQALRDPESALVLADKEQQRLLARLPQLLDTIRPETAATATVPRAVLRTATTAVAAEVNAFLGGLSACSMDVTTSAQWMQLQRRQTLVVALNETTHDFAAGGDALREARPVAPLLHALVEGLHALASTVIEAVERPEEAERELLLAMTADRGEMMERLRGKVLAASPELRSDARLQLIYVTSLFERAVWLLRQLIQTLPAPTAAITGTAPTLSVEPRG